MKEIVGIENVRIYKIRDNSIAAMHVADCCKAVMACRHPEPGPNAIPIAAEGCRIVCDDEEINAAKV